MSVLFDNAFMKKKYCYFLLTWELYCEYWIECCGFDLILGSFLGNLILQHNSDQNNLKNWYMVTCFFLFRRLGRGCTSDHLQKWYMWGETKMIRKTFLVWIQILLENLWLRFPRGRKSIDGIKLFTIYLLFLSFVSHNSKL